MLKQRLITAAVLLVIFGLALFAPYPEFFAGLALLFIAVAGWEWSRLNLITDYRAYLLGLLIAALGAGSLYFDCVSKLPNSFWYLVALLWTIVTPFVLKKGGSFWLSIPKTLRYFVGAIVLYTAWAALWKAKLAGNNFLLSILMLVWVADSGAYFGGKAFGKHKLAPSISPGKSWEGVISGVISVFIIVFLWLLFDQHMALSTGLSLYSVLLQKWSWLGLFLAVFFLTAMSVAGDLTESLMKRSVGMKDSSNILPGHGGVLDRIDALLPVLPISTAMACLASSTV